ncbi:MAG: hypothetical protein PHN56_06040 [Candidatus Nanoarchaeia archaeon]|nr:hypothetical protein [Candidatus Nanoarchaeia archaeon]
MKKHNSESLDEIILTECGREKGKKIYNFISDEFRRMDGYVGSTKIMENNLAYKELFYECYKTIDNYLNKKNENKGFSKKKYEKAIDFGKNNQFEVMKSTISEEVDFMINTTIDTYYAGHSRQIKITSTAYDFSIIVYYILTNFKGIDISKLNQELLNKQHEYDDFYV